MHPESHACHAKRVSHHEISRVHAIRPNANPHDTGPRTRRRSTRAPRLRHARSPQPATRNACPPCVHATCPDANTHGTARACRGHASGHAQTRPIPAACHAEATKMCTAPHPHAKTRSNTPDPRSLPRERDKKCARHHTHTLAVHVAPQLASLRAGFPHRAMVSKISSLPPRRPNRRI